MQPCGRKEELVVGSNSMWIPCLARVSYGPSVSGFQGWQGRRRDSPMRQRKLIGSTIDETDLRGEKLSSSDNTRTS